MSGRLVAEKPKRGRPLADKSECVGVDGCVDGGVGVGVGAGARGATD